LIKNRFQVINLIAAAKAAFFISEELFKIDRFFAMSIL